MKHIFLTVLFVHALAVMLLFIAKPPAVSQAAHKKLLVKTLILAREKVQEHKEVALVSETVIKEMPKQEEQKREVSSEKPAQKQVAKTPPPKVKKSNTEKEKPAPKQVKKETKPKAPQKKKSPAVAKKVQPKPVSAPIKKNSNAVEIAKKENAKKQELINQAIASLNSLHDKAPSKKSNDKAVAQLKKMESLHSEIAALDPEEDDYTTEGQKSYYNELVSRLKLSLRLPEYGEVKLRLTLSSQGKFLKLTILEAKSQQNRQYIEKNLKSLHFPAFGDNFPTEKEHTFLLKLRNG